MHGGRRERVEDCGKITYVEEEDEKETTWDCGERECRGARPETVRRRSEKEKELRRDEIVAGKIARRTGEVEFARQDTEMVNVERYSSKEDTTERLR